MRCFLREWCCLAALLLLPLGASAQDGPRRTVGPAVQEALAQKGSASVVVALTAPALLQRKGRAQTQTQRTTLNRQVDRLQSNVLSTVSADEFRVTERYTSVPALAGTLTSAAALQRLAAHPSVRRIDRDAQGGAARSPGLDATRVNQWHTEGVTGAGSTVAVLDSGIDTDHADLGDDLAHEACFLTRPQCPDGTTEQMGPGAAEDDDGHGTNVTGIITSDGTRAPRGVAPDADVVAVKVLNADGRFRSFSQIVDALDYLINHPELGVQVVNLSLGTDRQFAGVCDETTSYNRAGADAVALLRSQGVLPVASAMNKGSGTTMGSPACLEGVVSVGATADPRTLAEFSNSNETLEVAAPGTRIQSMGLGNRTSTYSGTSQAAPHVAGCAALLHAAKTDTTAAEVEASLKTSPVRATDATNDLTFPFLDCYTAGASVVVDALQADPGSGAAATPSFVLRWRTIREENSDAFVIERRPGRPSAPAPDAEWRPVGRVGSKAASGTSDALLRYRFEGTVPTPGRYSFRLRHATQDEPAAGQPTRAVTVLDVPFEGAVALGGPQPNPSTGRAEIEVVAEETQEVRVTLYDVLGRRLQRLYDGRLRAKRPLVLRTSGRDLASGTYFVRVVGDQFSATRKMVVAR